MLELDPSEQYKMDYIEESLSGRRSSKLRSILHCVELSALRKRLTHLNRGSDNTKHRYFSEKSAVQSRSEFLHRVSSFAVH